MLYYKINGYQNQIFYTISEHKLIFKIKKFFQN